MSKQIDAGLRAHLAGETLTLAACWEIERVDGKRFFFTDHDRSLTVNGDSYKPSSGFTRSAVKVTGDLAAQGMSVVGIFDDADIKDEDLIKGLFDGAKVRMFLVNYADLSQGILRLKYGRFGEVERATRNAFQVELVDLTQKLNQTRGERRQPTCRARLGDTRCNNADPNLPPSERNPVPIVVPERADATSYVEGDVIKVRTGPDPTSWVAPVVNGSFETGDLTGWTIVAGSGGFPAVLTTDDGVPNAQDGTYMVGFGDNDILDQVVDLAASPEFVAANVDAGLVSVKRFSAWQAEKNFPSNQDRGRVLLQALDGGGSLIGTLYDSGFVHGNPAGQWWEHSWSGLLPVGTRQLKIRFETPNNSSDTDVDFDNASITLEDAGQPAGTSFAYEDVIYRCTAAGTTAATAPAYDPTIGNTTVDGIASFTAELSYMMAGEVQSASDRKSFVAVDTLFTDALFDKPWFNLGGLIWEPPSANAGWVSEIRSAEPPDFTLKFATPFPIQIGDKFRLYPGCDLRLETCVAKWVHNPATAGRGNKDNFRGEAHLAGLDAGSFYPDAQS